jgi:8-oxo-dGTP pyrophosphatase MutT (NUDIX family)
MQAAAHTPGGYGGVSQAVGKEFVGDTSSEPGEAPISPHAGPAGRAAGILFLTPEGETLLLRRGDGGDFPRTFGLPGGHVEEGETDEEAARREALEETGFKYEGPITRLCSDGQFVTFIARDVEKFAVTLCDESTGFAWCRPDQAPEPLHPGLTVAFSVAAAHTELDVCRLIRDGALPSPQVFGNSMYFALRVTGTGQAYRTKLDEFVHRDESICLNPEFLERCNGLPVVWMHPEKNVLDTVSYAESNIGTVVLPYIQGGDVWAIARVLDMVAASEMAKPGAEWSTSPGVVFDERSGNVKVPLDDGTSILIEGTPFLIDHLAICERGVWDKDGPIEGVQIDQPIEVQMTEEERAKLAAEQKAKADAEAQARADAQPSLADIMNAVKGMASRLDSVEKNMPAPTLNSAADARKDAEEAKAKADAEAKAKCDAEEKAKADAAEMEAKAKADAEMEEKESEAAADEQAKADSVYQLHGKQAPRKMAGENLLGYRRRLLRGLQPHSAAWKGADLGAIGDSTALGIAAAAIYADAAAASRAPITDSNAPRMPRPMTRRSPSGHNVTEFSGPVGGWMDDFRYPVRGLLHINKGDKQ